MGFFARFFPKKRFEDGSVLWPSGREHFTFVDQTGNRFEFDVLYTTSASNAVNTIVGSSILTSNGTPVSSAIKAEILLKSEAYFTERGQQIVIA